MSQILIHTSYEDVTLLEYAETGIIDFSGKFSELFYNGTLQIIKNRNLVLQSDNTFHFVNPSKKHSPFFIRTSNILQIDEEINFIALQILPYVNEDLTEIRCDTSSIIPVIYAINLLRSLFGKQLYIPFSTFNSYSGVSSLRRGSLALISASSSGGLEDQILKTQKDVKVLTIVFNSSLSTNNLIGRKRDTIININKVFKSLIPAINEDEQFDDDKCKYCDRNSIAVSVKGDQFIPSEMVVQEIIFKKHYVQEWLRKAISDFTGQNSIYVNRSDAGTDKIREIYIDLTQSLQNPSSTFCKSFFKHSNNFLPSTIQYIFFAEDPSSKLIGEKIKEHLVSTSNFKSDNLISFRDVENIPNKETITTILVIASCVSNGNRINSISRKLRSFTNASIHYLLGVVKLSSVEARKILISNIESLQGDTFVNKAYILYEIYLPNHNSKRFKKFQTSPWIEERLFLEKVLKNESINEIIEDRLAIIESNKGLETNLFYGSPFSNQNLRLRPNFAFYNYKEILPSQADVYFIFACLFHILRNPILLGNRNPEDKFLIQHEHVKSLLDPENFSRYNDGVIQACLLRLANPSELDYSVNEEASLKMLSKLKNIFTEKDLESSEAIVEVLYAIASKKLKLSKNHQVDFLEYVKLSFTGYPIIDLFLRLSE